MNLAILCNHRNSDYGRAVLRALNARDCSGVHVVAATGFPASRSLPGLWRRYRLSLPWVFVRAFIARLPRWTPRRKIRSPKAEQSLEAITLAQGGKFCTVPEINGEKACRILHALQCDLLVLAGAPIIKAPILAIPRLGTINAHQGALPMYRGMNVIEWAIFENSPPTISIHYVDAGVDTGDIICEESVALYPGDTIATVRERASARQVELLADSALALLAERASRRRQLLEQGRQYFTMHPRLRAIAESRLQQKFSASRKQ